MGLQIARRLHKNGFKVLAWNRSDGPREDAKKAGIQAFASIDELVENMREEPRIFWLMLPHKIVDDFIFHKDLLGGYLRKGDIVIDGGNSFYKDSIKRVEELKAKGVAFFDCGTSGGVWGEENGFALMAGGPEGQWDKIEPIMKTLSGGENYGP
jgi:6-phosphogluconate dehydrogenase